MHARGASLVNSVTELEAAQQGIKAELAVLRSAVQQVCSGAAVVDAASLFALLLLFEPPFSHCVRRKPLSQTISAPSKPILQQLKRN